ncbi:MAG: hypothetical protein WDM76_09855 [Limisphaerales bacterium]
MNGHSNTKIEGKSIFWPDSSIKKLEAGYEEFIIEIHDDMGGKKFLHCIGYVGFQMIGFWDEVIVEKAMLHVSHQFIDDCEQRLKQLPQSGSTARITTGNRMLEILFIDGCKLWICASQFRCE